MSIIKHTGSILGAIALVTALSSAVWQGRAFYDEISEIRASVGQVDTQLEDMRSEVAKLETLKAEIVTLERRLKSQEQTVLSIDAKSATVNGQFQSIEAQVARFETLKEELEGISARVVDQEQSIRQLDQQAEQSTEIAERLNELETTVRNLPVQTLETDASVIEVDCLPLDRRVLVTGNKSWDFCESDWTIQLGEVQERGVVFGRSFYSVPRTLDGRWEIGGEGCILDLLELDTSDPDNRAVQVRGRCP